MHYLIVRIVVKKKNVYTVFSFSKYFLLFNSTVVYSPFLWHFEALYLIDINSVAVFNVGDYRRQAIGDYQGHDFFHPRNRDGTNIRNKCALDALQVRILIEFHYENQQMASVCIR